MPIVLLTRENWRDQVRLACSELPPDIAGRVEISDSYSQSLVVTVESKARIRKMIFREVDEGPLNFLVSAVRNEKTQVPEEDVYPLDNKDIETFRHAVQWRIMETLHQDGEISQRDEWMWTRIGEHEPILKWQASSAM